MPGNSAPCPQNEQIIIITKKRKGLVSALLRHIPLSYLGEETVHDLLSKTFDKLQVSRDEDCIYVSSLTGMNSSKLREVRLYSIKQYVFWTSVID